ncbi:MAG TPA: pentapeptide repeat-containing protein [Phenylobacterium sp.]|nr:pentapeptide repeat-containing protein [Phenylobacterium sp.]
MSNLDLRGRDFSGAHLEEANASRSNFAECSFVSANTRGFIAEGADFSEISAPSTVFFGVNFRGASLRGARLARSSFTRANLSNTDLIGADFSNAVLNEGTTFEGAEIDESTKFDGAKIFRPLARQPAFRFYRVERGVLVRNEGVTTVPPPAQEAVRPTPALDSLGPPRFEQAEGSFSVDFRNHDGRVLLGQGDWLFETMWATAGDGSIHVVNETSSVKSVAVATGAHVIEDVSDAVFAVSDFTSRYRTPQVGEVVLVQNTKGYAAAIEIQRVKVTPESQRGSELRARYRILTDGSRNFSARGVNAERAELIEAVDAALVALRVMPFAEEPPPAGIGHNNPPADAALSAEDHEAVRSTLLELRTAVTAEPVNSEVLRHGRDGILAAGRKILAWAGARYEEVQSGFFTQVGAALATTLAVHLALTGKLGAVIAAITNLIGL